MNIYKWCYMGIGIYICVMIVEILSLTYNYLLFIHAALNSKINTLFSIVMPVIHLFVLISKHVIRPLLNLWTHKWHTLVCAMLNSDESSTQNLDFGSILFHKCNILKMSWRRFLNNLNSWNWLITQKGRIDLYFFLLINSFFLAHSIGSSLLYSSRFLFVC